MVDNSKPAQVTPPLTVMEELLDCRVAKTEREWAASREIAYLWEELADIKESYRNVVEGKCAGDEKHCACVPALRETDSVIKRAGEIGNFIAKECLYDHPGDASIIGQKIRAYLLEGGKG